MGTKTGLFGVGLAIVGAAHFFAPAAFRDATKLAYPEDTDAWIQRNGATEVALGTAIAIPATRRFGLAALGAYFAWLGARVGMVARS